MFWPQTTQVDIRDDPQVHEIGIGHCAVGRGEIGNRASPSVWPRLVGLYVFRYMLPVPLPLPDALLSPFEGDYASVIRVEMGPKCIVLSNEPAAFQPVEPLATSSRGSVNYPGPSPPNPGILHAAVCGVDKNTHGIARGAVVHRVHDSDLAVGREALRVLEAELGPNPAAHGGVLNVEHEEAVPEGVVGKYED